jgi:hypothetical protein
MCEKLHYGSGENFITVIMGRISIKLKKISFLSQINSHINIMMPASLLQRVGLYNDLDDLHFLCKICFTEVVALE